MKFFPVLPSHAREGPYLKRRNQAQPSSAQSDPPLLEIRYNVRTAWESLCLLYLSLHLNYWETEVVVRTISQRAYQHSYEGEWQVVQRFLEEQLDTPQQYEERWKELSGRPLEEFYGNLVPYAAKMEKRLDYRDTSKAATGKVRRPQRKRGYADKGSCRLPHEKHGSPPVKEKEDRRNLIMINPLLRNSTSEGDVASAHTNRRKEGES